MSDYILPLIRRFMPKTWQRYKKFMLRWRRLFISPAERQFAVVMGSRAFTLDRIKDSNGHPLTLILWSEWFKEYGCVHQYQVRGYQIDFGFTKRRGIEIDGDYDARGHKIHNIVSDQRRSEHLAKSRWSVIRIPAVEVNPNSKYYKPDKVRKMAYDFIGWPKSVYRRKA